MYYCQSRYYVPEWSRWLIPDDFAYLQFNQINGLNSYAYCENNPIMNVDSMGHMAISASLWLIGCLIVLCATDEATDHKLSKTLARGLEGVFDNIYDDIASLLNNSAKAKSVQSIISASRYSDVDSFSDEVTSFLTSYTILLSEKISKKNTNHDKHHIVAKKDTRAYFSRTILYANKIGIDNEENTVYVVRHYHWYLHTNLYHYQLFFQLLEAHLYFGKAGVLGVLKKYKEVLQNLV